MTPRGTLLITRSEVQDLLTLETCMEAVEHAFRLYGEGKTGPPGILGVHCTNGGFHLKAGVLSLDRPYFAAKINANFPDNPRRFKLPTIQGVVALSDANNGYPLALIDSIEVTILRTGAATGIAAKYLARPDSKVATICGCGHQGRVSVQALKKVLPIQHVWAYDLDPAQADHFASLAKELEVEIEITTDLAAALKQSDVCVTCTTSTQAFVEREHISPGTFIAAVGADNPQKQELEPALFSGNKVVVDIIEQCESIGDLHHALEAGAISKDQVYAELGEVVAGLKSGRTSDDEIIIFDSTGMALQDVVAAAAVYERALAQGVGKQLDFAQ